MNKLKLLYDVATTMRKKEKLTGVLDVAVSKDKANIFSLQNEFTKNLATGQTQAKISTELDYEGKKVKHESNTEFTLQGHCCHRPHGFTHHMHRNQGGGCCGIKGKLSKIAFVFGILNSLQVNEQEDGTAVVSLTLKEIPEDIKELVQEKIEHIKAHHPQHPGCMKEFCNLEARDLTFNMLVNKNYELEDINVTVAGTQRDEQQQPQPHDVKASVKLSFSW